ncbi:MULTISPECIES: hypothetical protein [Halomonadaceae]|jgi:hypothetical protein|uniref:Uncharacterized protein n=1 Tax=Vreelandella aquamarina TaxID=77097 RepID=A0A1N6K5D9_9GAMM|nr:MULTISPECIES: hypothetical protein [Halomonas]MCC4289248.1 hypothetical protein [Halomonas meridiana]MCP1304621.1 hypothetical protein [Halomonas sp. R1t8]MCP1330892.1 hypothetical protein [Halomonas sp. R1t4]SIN85225.1 hypothetical protein SAMN05878249_3807 [Halomonas meridiana]SIN87365.1 hypothetical protein SAMN05878438_3740 [Halomonas meridiana]
MVDQITMPPRAGYSAVLTNDFMVILRDHGEIVSVREDADSVLEHLSCTIPGGLKRQRVYVEEVPGGDGFYELKHQHGNLDGVEQCSSHQADHLKQLVSSETEGGHG